MAVNINISGTNISGNANVLNGLKIQGENNTDISINKSSISGKSQILNNMNISGKSSIEIENFEMKENAKVLNDIDVENNQVNVKIKDLSLGKGAEFMNNKKFTERTSYQQTQKKSTQTTYKQDTTEKTTKRSAKKDGFLKRLLKLILKSQNMEENKEATYSQKTHKDFEDEVSMGGKLKNQDISEALQSAKKDAERLKREQKNTDKNDRSL